MKETLVIHTIGHSTRSGEDFIGVLKHYRIACLADVRTVPRSRHNPQFSAEVLQETLMHADIRYLHLKALGGLRHARADSRNLGWRNPSFRGFADYMQTQEFRDALAELMEVGRRQRTAIMCAEAVPWRCHRSLIGDALIVAGAEVLDIFDEKHVTPHKLSPMARVVEGVITYPPEAGGE